jgi:hypothetical protein
MTGDDAIDEDDIKESAPKKVDVVQSAADKDSESGIDKLKDEVGDIIHTAEEVGKEIWDDIKELFDGKDKKHPNKTVTADSASSPSTTPTTSPGPVRLF